MQITKINGAISASANIGVNAGYGHSNEVGINLDDLCELNKKLAAQVMAETGVYVSSVIGETRCCYSDDWGCPKGGEKTFSLSADCNPTYSSLPTEEYTEKWKLSFLRLVELLMEELEQSAVTAKVGNEVLYFSR